MSVKPALSVFGLPLRVILSSDREIAGLELRFGVLSS